ncbi:MAG: transglycosylase domain-containing protein [Eubacteriales bacterium]|nr:transglycosylase domain-containing protein [Eubacteriales bacterium]
MWYTFSQWHYGSAATGEDMSTSRQNDKNHEAFEAFTQEKSPVSSIKEFTYTVYGLARKAYLSVKAALSSGTGRKSTSRKKPVASPSLKPKPTHNTRKPSRYTFRPKKLIKSLLVTAIIFGIMATGLLSGVVVGYVRSTVPITADQLRVSNFISYVYDSTGEHLIGELASVEKRIWVDYDDTPKYMHDAIISIEDERFDQHPGIDIKGLISAFVKKILNPTSLMAGASTLTQQVIKNLTGEDDRSVRRKVQEQWRSLLLETQLDKWEILQLYMNVMTTGVNMYGVEIAAQTYFDRTAASLTLAQCAFIAGITNNPSVYNPYTTKGRENALKRMDVVLYKMLELGKITQVEYETALNEELVFFEKDESNEGLISGKQTYFVDQVILDVKKDLIAKGMSESAALNMIYNSGIRIITTMDVEVQKALDDIYTNPQNFPVTNPYAPHPQASVVIIDPRNGQVRAMYGGYGEKEGNTLNRATQIQRPPGSSIKPIAVYAPALNEKLITAATIIDDAPVYMLGYGTEDDESQAEENEEEEEEKKPERYPENYDKTYSGLTPVRDAVRKSLNVVAAKIWRDILGADLSLKYLKSVGINRDQRNVSLALGGLEYGVNPLQMSAAYASFANRGIYYQPVTYLRVYDASGRLVLDKRAQNPAIVYSEATAYIMTDILKDVCRNGTAYPYGIISNARGDLMFTAGKTGTTSDNRDKWFVGFTAYYVCATWYGYDNNAVIPEGAERNQALNLWNLVMTRIHSELEPLDFEEPPGIEKADICIRSGLLPDVYCTKDPIKTAMGVPQEAVRYDELFLKGTVPSEKCDVHIKVKVCRDSTDEYGRNLPASEYCPSSSIIEKVLIGRRVPYIPYSEDDPLPADFMYDYPSLSECDVHTKKPQPTISGKKKPGTSPSSSSPTPGISSPTESEDENVSENTGRED